jgi:hypothetical protein
MIRALVPLIALAACTTSPAANETAQAPPRAEPTLPGECDAGQVQDIVGQTYTDTMGRAALTRTGLRTLRLIRPGMAVTMDYRTDRLNIEVNEDGVVTTVRCG